MSDNQPTTKQIVFFAVVLSFIVSVVGTVLTFGVLGPLAGAESTGQFVFNRPQILERIRETITQTQTAERVLRQDELVVKVVEEASPAVVSVVATKDVPVIERFFVDPFGDDPLLREFFGDRGSGFRIPQFRQRGTQKQETGAGTGFIVSADGMVVTNKHVVADAEAEYTVLMNDGKKKPAKVLARDPVQDLAILKIEGANPPSLRLGDSSGVKIGQSVIAIGNALGEFSNTVSVGVVSGLHRSVIASGGAAGPEALQELIQTDAAINPGNSGGPLLNLHGEVIGINTAIAQGAENIGFALPVNNIKRAIEMVKQTGRISYPFLGVRYVIITKDLAQERGLGRDYGALLAAGDNEPAVVADSPAGRAGLRSGDIILEFGGERIETSNALAQIIRKYSVGQDVTLKIFREAKEFEVRLRLEERK